MPFLSLLAPFVALPFIAAATDPTGWASLAIGQSLGGLASLVVAFGWPLNGPVEVASGTRSQVGETYYDSLLSRSLVMAVASGPILAASVLAAPAGHALLVASIATATTATAFSWNWVAIGLGQPRLIVLYDVLPKMASIAAAVLIIANGGSLLWYPAALLTSTAVSLLLSARRVVRPANAGRAHLQTLARRLRHQLPYVATTTAGGAYSAAAIFIVGLATTTHATAVASSADRFYRIGLLSVVALASAFQAWVVHVDAPVARRRRLVALRSHAVLAVVGGSAMALGAPLASRVLFGASLSPSWKVTAWYGLAFACVAISTSLALHFLLPGGARAQVLACTVFGAAAGVPAVFLLARSYGSVGAAAGIGLSELLVLLLAAAFAVRGRQAHATH
ncbi:hypothetical protein LRP67_03505 [Nocardioides sp. cx-169]|uniref:hypothetical protein n=1 Tax=Nocardioides sp. cx-169 TaxID=2899080 RepID=UPI001E3C3345|nr:hypothetical protein [Nocardioides sp. cx-169]MCD4533145.1 hypothetical protein [Nocardioides sp. cx-169]